MVANSSIAESGQSKEGRPKSQVDFPKRSRPQARETLGLPRRTRRDTPVWGTNLIRREHRPRHTSHGYCIASLNFVSTSSPHRQFDSHFRKTPNYHFRCCYNTLSARYQSIEDVVTASFGGHLLTSKQDLLRRSRATAGSGKRNVRLGVWKVVSCQASFYLAADLTLGTLMGELGL